MERNVVNWFEIPVTDMNRARKFYETVFKKKLTETPMPDMQMMTFPWNKQGVNTSGALVKAKNIKPTTDGTRVYFQCDDVNNEIKMAESNGGKTIMSKTSVGTNGYIAIIIDTEGNHIGLHSMK
ncbi:MAG: VOC family protein [Bacteroidota bacterium]|nr:VOC family protein [Bacteroidota bacterium]